MIPVSFLVFGITSYLIACFFEKRTLWLEKELKKMIGDDFGKYKQLPGFAPLLFKFWVWDLEKYARKYEKL